MAYMIEITESKFDKACEHVEQAMKSIGKVMQCFTEWEEENSMGHREGSYGNRNNYGGRYGGGHMNQRYPIYGGYGMGYKDDEDWDDEEMAERRGGRRRDSRGRYI